ncbi:MAG: translocation/assembly module TamB domain-containing protein [Acidobacteria bacterium]|nr:translocation/assembly module TamB domain-containing protein [Acidobacteriota bacterium]MBI3655573.1 translocation/assembly module TamB domain-containing protein [Acidobacteriota bacterium]
MKVRWRVFGIGLLLGLCGLLVAVIILSQSRWVAGIVKQRILQVADHDYRLSLKIKHLNIDVLGRTLTLNGLEISSKSRSDAPPIFTAKQITLRYRLLNIFTRALALEELRVQQPVLRVAWGVDNLFFGDAPAARPSMDHLFNYSIQKLIIRDGKIELEDRTIPWSCQFESWASEAAYRGPEGKYDIHLAFAHGRIAWEHEALVDVGVEAHVEWSRQALRLRSSQGRVPGLSLRGSLDVSSFRPLRYTGYFDSDISLADLQSHADWLRRFQDRLPTHGFFKINGTIVGDDGEVAVAAEWQAPSLTWRELLFENVTATLAMDSRGLKVSRLRATVAGGTIQVDYQWLFRQAGDRMTPGGRSVLHCTLDSVAVRPLVYALWQKRIPLDSRTTGHGRFDWAGHQFDRISGDGEFTFAALNHPHPRESIPLSGRTSFLMDQGHLSVRPSLIEYGSIHSELSGRISRSGECELALAARSEDADDVSRRLSFFGFDLGRSAPEARVGGAFKFEGSLRGRFNQPELAGQLKVATVEYNRESWQEFSTTLNWTVGRVRFINAAARHGEAEVHSDLSVEWPDRLVVDARLLDVPLKALKSLAVRSGRIAEAFNYPVEGLVSGHVHISGAVAEPSVQARVAMKSLVCFGQPLDKARAEIRYSNSQIEAQAVSIQKGATSMTVYGFLNLEQRRFQVKGALRALRLSDVVNMMRPLHISSQAAALSLEGIANAEFEASGSMDDPVIRAKTEVKDINWRRIPIGSINILATGRGQTLRFRAALQGGPHSATATGTISATDLWPLEMSIDAKSLSIPRLLAFVAVPAKPVEGEMSGTITAALSLREPAQTLVGSAHITRARVKAEPYWVENAGDLILTYRADEIVLQKFRWRHQGTELEVAGSFGMKENGGLNLKLLGTAQLELLNTWLPNMKAAGTAAVQVLITGTRAHPNIVGEAKVTRANLQAPDWPTPIFDTEAHIKFTASQARLTGIKARTKYGLVQGDGAVFLKGFKPQQWAVDLRGNNLRIPEPEGFVSMVNADVSLLGGERAQWLRGRVTINSSVYKKKIELSDLILAHSKTDMTTPAPVNTSPFFLDLDIRGAETIKVRTNFADIVGSADLRLKGTWQSPVLLGRLTISQGSLNLQDYRYHINNGAINFSDPRRTTPVLRLQAETTVKAYTVTLEISGPLNKLTLSVRSDPPLSTVEVLNLLAAGQEPVGTAAHEVAPSALLGEMLLKEWEARAGRVVGLDRLTIDPFAVGGIANPTTRLTLQKQINRNLSVTYSTSLAESQENVVLVEYLLSDRLAIVAARDERGKLGLDFKIKKRF